MMPRSEKPPSEERKAVSPTALRTAAREKALGALNALEEIMAAKGQTAVRLAAAREILDRGYGRPKVIEPKPAAARGGLKVIVKEFTPRPKPSAVDDGGAV